MWDNWQGAFKGIDRAVSDGLVLKIEGSKEPSKFLIKLTDPKSNEVKDWVEIPYLGEGLLLISNNYLGERESVSPPLACPDQLEEMFEQRILDGMKVYAKTAPDYFMESMEVSGGGVGIGTDSVLDGISSLGWCYCADPL